MKYSNLNELLKKSSTSRKYLYSLPISKQLIIHDEYADSIHSAADLHNAAYSIDEKMSRMDASNALDIDTANY